MRQGRDGSAARKQLIMRSMRFVLQRDVRWFRAQLLSRLLEEGCNLNSYLAQNMFYEYFERRVASHLPQEHRDIYFEKQLRETGFSHHRFHKAVKYFAHHLADAETKITAAVLDVLDALKQEWQHTAEKCLTDVKPDTAHLQDLISRISHCNPDGLLASHGLDTIRRRLKIAIITSLLRHDRRPDSLKEKYGGIRGIIRDLDRNPDLFTEIIAVIEKRIPYNRQIVTRSFWRTLNNMDFEI